MKEEIKFFIERSKKFERDAKFDFKNKDYDLAMFHLEQAVQLIIKAKLLELKGYFDKTHNIRKLLMNLMDVGFKKEKLKAFVKKYKIELRNLERAYITSRYIYEEFFKDEVLACFKLLDELKKILEF